jgi:H/ACA ribonucleoprotein complex subunit 2
MDVLSHLPVLCEDAGCPYLFVPSKESLGQASATKRPTSCIMMVMETDASKLKGNKKAAEILTASKSDPEKAKELEEYSRSL